MDKKQFFGYLNLLQIFILTLFLGGFIAFIRDPVLTSVNYPVGPTQSVTSFDEREVMSNILHTMVNHSHRAVSSNVQQVVRTGLTRQPLVDVHYEADGIGLTFDTSGHRHTFARTASSQIVPRSVAMGLGITSKKSSWESRDKMVSTFPFFKTFLPTFCATASPTFYYNFFMAHDKTDPFFTKSENSKNFAEEFYKRLSVHKCPTTSNYSLHFVKCSHSGKPAWAQNDAMMSAYMSNMEYFYRVNDDTKMKTKGWTEVFIKRLQQFRPTYVGVVGPTHSRGNTGILTYDFVHYTHIELYGFYYPRRFDTWYADAWITRVYQPGRSVKEKGVLLEHTLEKGQRYKHKGIKPAEMKSIIESHKHTIERYV